MALNLTDVGFDAAAVPGDVQAGLVAVAGFDHGGASFWVSSIKNALYLSPDPASEGAKIGAPVIRNDFTPDARHKKGYGIELDGVNFSDDQLTINGQITADRVTFKASFAGVAFGDLDLSNVVADVFVVYRWNDTGEVAQRYKMMTGQSNTVQVHNGPRSVTTTVTFVGTPPDQEAFFNRDVPAPEYYSLSNGRYSIRLPVTWAFAVGDSIHFDHQDRTITKINYTLSPKQEFMTVEAS